VDTGNQGLLLWGLKRAKKPADSRFPFGHGREIYFWSFVVAIMIFGVGAGVSIFEGIKHLLHPREITSPTVNYIVLGAAMVFEGVAWWIALKAFRQAKGEAGYLEAVQKGKDPTLFVVLFEDSAAMAGLIVAFLGIYLGQITGWLWLDGAASVIIGLILAAVALWLAFETKGLLIGESASEGVRDQVRKMVSGADGVEKIHELLTLQMGPESILVVVSMDFADRLDATAVENTVADMRDRIREEVAGVSRVFIQVEPAPVPGRLSDSPAGTGSS
jgi:cation diffusion facilitator family transporter